MNIERLKQELLELEKNIKIYEDAYKNFKIVYDSVHDEKREPTDDERRVVSEFKSFCRNEGIYSGENWSPYRYQKCGEQINDRLETMKKRKEIVSKYVELLKKMDKLELDKDTQDRLKKEAENHYSKGTEQYNRFLEKKIKEEKTKLRDNLQTSLDKTKEDERKLKQENNRRSVLKSVLPSFTGLHNLRAKVHNANVKFQKRHPILNTIVKMGLPIAGFLSGVSLVSSMGLMALSLPGVVALASIPAAVVSFRHIFMKKSREQHLKTIEMHEKKTKTSLKDALFKFRKARGKSHIATENELYNGIDFSHYDKSEASHEESVHADEPELEHDTEKQEEKTTPTMEDEETSKVQDEQEMHESTEDESKSKTDTNEVLHLTAGLPVQESSSFDDSRYIPGTTILKPRVRNNGESDEAYQEYLREYYASVFPSLDKQDDSKKETDTSDSKIKQEPTSSEVEQEAETSSKPKNSKLEWLQKMRELCKYFDEKGIHTVADYRKLKEAIESFEREGIRTNDHDLIRFAVSLRDYEKSITPELRERILIGDRFNGQLDYPKKNNMARNDARNQIVELIKQEKNISSISREIRAILNGQDIVSSNPTVRKIQELLKGYNITDATKKRILEAIVTTNETTNESRKRGK